MQKFFIALSLSLAALAACKKDDDGTKPPPSTTGGTCRLQTINMAFDGRIIPNTATYDSAGRIVSFKWGSNTPGGTGTITTFQHFGNNQISIGDGSGYRRDTVTLNSDGLVTSVHTAYVLSGIPSRTEYADYTYSGTEVQRIVFTASDNSSRDTTTYFWSDGNMVKSVDNDNGTTLYEYYTDKPVVDRSDALVFLDYQAVLGAEVVRNRNLIKRVVYSSGTVGDVDYELDAAGRVKKCTLSTGGIDAGYYALGYQCQ